MPKHNLLTDAPFTKLDLLSCRNLLIYLDAKAQHKLVPLFHYALKPNGILFSVLPIDRRARSGLCAVDKKPSSSNGRPSLERFLTWNVSPVNCSQRPPSRA